MSYLYLNEIAMMTYRNTEIWKAVDWITVLLYIVLVIAGWFSVCGASYEFDSVSWFDPTGRPGSQLIWMILSVVLIFVILMISNAAPTAAVAAGVLLALNIYERE